MNIQSIRKPTFRPAAYSEEAALLRTLAAQIHAGCIVEIGSRGSESAIALASGIATRSLFAGPAVFCINPCTDGVDTRSMFYQAILDAACADTIALVDTKSAAAAKTWTAPIGLLLFAGNCSAAEIESWTRFLIEGGVAAFDTGMGEPANTIAQMMASGAYRRMAGAGKIVVLRKLADKSRKAFWVARHAASENIRRLATGAGYEPGHAVSRLSYGSFVSLPHRYMYMETPKAACTAIKQLIVTMENAPYDRHARPYCRETRKDMLIHQRRHVGIPALLDVPSPERAAILAGVDGWFVFAVSRNPYSRLVSVFENKVRTGEPRYRALQARYGDEGPFADPKQAFSAFVAEVAADPRQRKHDPHLTAQEHLLMPRMIPYTHIFKLERIDDMKAALRAHIAAQGGPAAIELAKQNSSFGHPWRDYYDNASARAVAEAYAEDFAAFDYDPEDWQGGQTTVAETETYRRWRAELVERNAFIDCMFDWMDELRET